MGNLSEIDLYCRSKLR